MATNKKGYMKKYWNRKIGKGGTTNADKYLKTEKYKKENRERKKARYNYEKKNGKLAKGMEVDHKIPISKGGSNLLSNLRAVKRLINRKKKNKTR